MLDKMLEFLPYLIILAGFLLIFQVRKIPPLYQIWGVVALGTILVMYSLYQDGKRAMIYTSLLILTVAIAKVWQRLKRK